MTTESSIWRAFEKDFRAIPDPFYCLRADHQENTPDPCGLTGWRVTGSPEAARFKAIAVLAGNALWREKSLRRILPDEVIMEPDPLNRWLTAVRLMTNAYEHCWVGYEVNENGSRGSRILSGYIRHVVEVSALLCLQLAAHEQEMGSDRAEIPASFAPKRRKSFRHHPPSALHEAVKDGIRSPLRGERLWGWVDIQASQNKKIKPLPGWMELWPGTFTKAYKGHFKRKLNTLATRIRKSLSHSGD